MLSRLVSECCSGDTSYNELVVDKLFSDPFNETASTLLNGCEAEKRNLACE